MDRDDYNDGVEHGYREAEKHMVSEEIVHRIEMQYDKHIESICEERDLLKSRLASRDAEIARLREVLRERGTHRDSCHADCDPLTCPADSQVCDCGLDQALAGKEGG